MNVIGDKKRFAVEYALVDGGDSEWLYGHFCFFFFGIRVGDFDLVTSLRDVLFQLEEQAWASGNRSNQRFDLMQAHDAFRVIDRAMFGNSDSNYLPVVEEEQWARHNILPPVDVFDYWKAYCIENENSARIIFSSHPYENVQEVTLRSGELDSVLKIVRSELALIYEKAH